MKTRNRFGWLHTPAPAPPGPPGTIRNQDAAQPTLLEVITYGPDGSDVRSMSAETAADLASMAPEPAVGVRWLIVTGVHNGALLHALGATLGITGLQIEDIQHLDQRPKLEVGDRSLFAVLRMIRRLDETRELRNEQISIYASGRTVVVFQEEPGDVFSELRDRVRTGRGRIRSAGADYLVYALIDAVVDGVLFAADHLQSRIEDVESDIVQSPAAAVLPTIHGLRGAVVSMRRAIWPLREFLGASVVSGPGFFDPSTVPFLSDTQDHVLALIDIVDSQVDRVTALFQLHAAMLGASTNETMRVLTIIATIFIPLTFVAGIYGMNFAFMPELTRPWGYPVVLGAMALIAGGMVVFFRRKKWL